MAGGAGRLYDRTFVRRQHRPARRPSQCPRGTVPRAERVIACFVHRMREEKAVMAKEMRPTPMLDQLESDAYLASAPGVAW